jgi:uncharacterized protein YigA (DUF484 family)
MPKDVDILQAKLDALIRMAKNNEQKLNNFQEYELSLFNTNGLHQLLAVTLKQHPARLKLSDVTFLLFGPEYAFRRLLDNLPGTPE